MGQFITDPVRVSVPATSANLGPGFDSLGLALGLRDTLTGTVLPAGLEVVVSGAGADAVPLDESHLVVRSMRAAFDALGGQPTGLRLVCDNVIPHARGMGSSSAAIVGGLALARAMVPGAELVMGQDSLFELAAEIEGHPDNVAPACFGGFVISGREEKFYAVSSSVDPRISAVVFIPSAPVETSVARGLLPEVVPHAEAAANAGRTALLVAAIGGQPEQLPLATRDFLHQSYRQPAMPESLALVQRLRAAGTAAVISGAGPTVLAFTDGPVGDDNTAAAGLLAQCPSGWRARHLPIDLDGVRVLAR